MREIKFRAWDTEDKEFVYFDWVCGVFPHMSNDDNHKGRFICQQYTGLKDKNGKEIYEGDLVRWYWEEAEKDGPIGEVTFKTLYDGHDNTVNGATGWVVVDCFLNENAEVIGNIWENPELRRTSRERKEGVKNG